MTRAIDTMVDQVKKMYYVDKMTQGMIALELNISRRTVAMIVSNRRRLHKVTRNKGFCHECLKVRLMPCDVCAAREERLRNARTSKITSRGTPPWANAPSYQFHHQRRDGR